MLSRALENSSSLLNSLFTTRYHASTYPTIFFGIAFYKPNPWKFSLSISAKKREGR